MSNHSVTCKVCLKNAVISVGVGCVGVGMRLCMCGGVCMAGVVGCEEVSVGVYYVCIEY